MVNTIFDNKILAAVKKQSGNQVIAIDFNKKPFS